MDTDTAVSGGLDYTAGIYKADGRVLEEIDNFNQTGRVMLNGMEWTARNISSEGKIPAGTKVEVMEIKGAHLVVQEWR